MRAGSYCIILTALASHLDPSWGPESDKFRPERWLDGDFRNNKDFAPFSVGKRACLGIWMKITLITIHNTIVNDSETGLLKHENTTTFTGKTYAVVSMKVTLAHFIRQYRVTVDMSKLKMKYEFIMRPVSGHEISIERRLWILPVIKIHSHELDV